MKFIIKFGQALTLFVWVVVFYNLFFPMQSPINIALYLTLGLMCIFHLLQVVLCYSVFGHNKLTKQNYFLVFIFGFFGLLILKNQFKTKYEATNGS